VHSHIQTDAMHICMHTPLFLDMRNLVTKKNQFNFPKNKKERNQEFYLAGSHLVVFYYIYKLQNEI
jgi:hypothetical protein